MRRMTAREASLSSTTSKAWWPSGWWTSSTGRPRSGRGGHEPVDVLVQLPLVEAGPHHQQRRQLRDRVEVGRRP